jgi:hypothetical protein
MKSQIKRNSVDVVPLKHCASYLYASITALHYSAQPDQRAARPRRNADLFRTVLFGPNANHRRWAVHVDSRSNFVNLRKNGHKSIIFLFSFGQHRNMTWMIGVSHRPRGTLHTPAPGHHSARHYSSRLYYRIYVSLHRRRSSFLEMWGR